MWNNDWKPKQFSFCQFKKYDTVVVSIIDDVPFIIVYVVSWDRMCNNKLFTMIILLLAMFSEN